MSKSITERVVDIIADKLGVEPAEVVPSANFVNDLRADSLDVVELIMEMEQEFGLKIPDTDMEKFNTVGDAITYIETH